MKRSFLFSISVLILFFSSFNVPKKTSWSTIKSCDQIPALNQNLIEFVKNNLNKKVGRGECWDLAAQGLNTIGANWDKNYVFGKEIDLKKDCVYPGDIIQFEGVEIQYQKKNTFYREEVEHHTAIIFKVNNKQSFVLAEQNTTELGKKVGTSTLELKNILKGTFKIYRPVN